MGRFLIYNIFMKTFRYNLVFQAEPEGGFTVIVPALPGCVSYGKNLKQAKLMAEDAIIGYLKSLKKRGKPIPSNDMWIAASAARHGLALFTFDDHFHEIEGIVLQAFPKGE